MDTLDMTSCFYLFASPYVAERVYLALYEIDKEKLMSFMALDFNTEVYSLRAELLVYHAARMIGRSERFRIRPLTSHAPGRNPGYQVLRLGPYNMVRYYDPVAIMKTEESLHIDCRVVVDGETRVVKESGDLHTYYQHQHKYDRHYLAKDPVVVDGLDKRGCLFIHTTLDHMEIDLTSVLESVAAMDNPMGPVRLYLCKLPFRGIASMPAQPYVYGTGDNKQVLPPDTIPNVTQYLLELPEGYDSTSGEVKTVPNLPPEENDLVLNDEGHYENIMSVYAKWMSKMSVVELQGLLNSLR
ncbi:hypothetical protein KIPB_002909 [Kipferlia bialata]|uniref:Uncharacterized protein n=1 Tax=Kipferlia bialata TaxID=797122 RepID=A0A9K3CUK4_9EUKA|nr:hypothetical protein KIPB_002909 [Kipferlia bialata]|eukprot:g2909.t1